MPYTKKTVAIGNKSINEIGDTISPDGADVFHTKLYQLVNEGKTDGILYGDMNGNVATRLWIDITAAEEWIEFITQLLTDYSDVNLIQSVTIEDNLPS